MNFPVKVELFHADNFSLVVMYFWLCLINLQNWAFSGPQIYLIKIISYPTFTLLLFPLLKASIMTFKVETVLGNQPLWCFIQSAWGDVLLPREGHHPKFNWNVLARTWFTNRMHKQNDFHLLKINLKLNQECRNICSMDGSGITWGWN